MASQDQYAIEKVVCALYDGDHVRVRELVREFPNVNVAVACAFHCNTAVLKTALKLGVETNDGMLVRSVMFLVHVNMMIVDFTEIMQTSFSASTDMETIVAFIEFIHPDCIDILAKHLIGKKVDVTLCAQLYEHAANVRKKKNLA